MQVIWKFALPIADDAQILMPSCARILSAGLDADGRPAVWALVNSLASQEIITFHVAGTGHPDGGRQLDMARHLGTFVHGEFVWHVFLRDGSSATVYNHQLRHHGHSGNL